jgi:hypothetical protein
MPKTITAIVLALIWAVGAAAQTPPSPPTIAECRAYQPKWWAELEKTGGPTVTYIDLQFYIVTMTACMQVDTKYDNEYKATVQEAISFSALRYSAFLKRHGLFEQFVSEDLSGAR